MSWGVNDLTVRFGQVDALSSVSLEIVPGEVHTVIGGDGAGKSTLLRVLVGLTRGMSGAVSVPDRERIGFVPGHGGVFDDLSIDENVEFVAAAYGLKGWQARADELLERAGLASFGDRLAGRLSGGERRKLAGSMALLSEPRMLVLDEVTTGVDPVSRMDLWRLMASAAASDVAIVAATTYLDEAERADTVTLLHEGHLLASGGPTAIVESMPGTVRELDEPHDRSTAWRIGRRWRQWEPAASGSSRQPCSLEDAAIVHELMAEREGAPS